MSVTSNTRQKLLPKWWSSWFTTLGSLVLQSRWTTQFCCTDGTCQMEVTKRRGAEIAEEHLTILFSSISAPLRLSRPRTRELGRSWTDSIAIPVGGGERSHLAERSMDLPIRCDAAATQAPINAVGPHVR